MLDEATLLVPDGTICNPIDDFKLGVVALTDTSLSFGASDVSNPTAAKRSEWRSDPGRIHSEGKEKQRSSRAEP